MLDFDLASLYEVETRALKQSVRRNLVRFPVDFMFEMKKDEWQEVITNCDNLPDNVKFSPKPPMAFTEQGIAMLSSVLRSEKAVLTNIAIMRTFVAMRDWAQTNQELMSRLDELERKYDKKFKDVFEALNYLLDKEQVTRSSARSNIGFRIEEKKP